MIMFGLQFLFKPDLFKVATLDDLREANRQLREKGLPDFFLGIGKGGKVFNPSYSIARDEKGRIIYPRFVVGFSGIRLTQFYISPSVSKGDVDYIHFVNAFYPEVETADLPQVITKPEITIFLDYNR